MTGRTSKVELLARVETVVRWVIAGLRSSQIRESVRAEYGVSEATAFRYLRRARGLIEQEAAGHRRYALALAVVQLNEIYRRAMEAGDCKAAVMAVRERSKLLGLYGPQRVDVTIKDVGTTVDQILGLGPDPTVGGRLTGLSGN